MRFVIVGGGPAGNTAATHAARLGAEVTIIERDVVGGSANLWDCIPSKAMIATGGAMALTRRAEGMGLAKLDAELDFEAVRERILRIEQHLCQSTTGLLASQGVRVIRGVGRMKGPHEVVAETEDGIDELSADAVLLAIGSVPSSEGRGLEAAGVHTDDGGYVPVNHHCQSNVAHIYAAGDLSGKLPLASVAHMQGRKVAEHVMGLHSRQHRHLDYEKAASAIFTEPEIADVGLAEAEAFAIGRKIRVTKVPYAANARALIDGDPRGFVKILSDPATGVVLGGSIVGQNASELISVLALAVTANLKVTDIVESLLVHPALAEALADAAE